MLSDAADSLYAAIKSQYVQGRCHFLATSMFHHTLQQLCPAAFTSAPIGKINYSCTMSFNFTEIKKVQNTKFTTAIVHFNKKKNIDNRLQYFLNFEYL